MIDLVVTGKVDRATTRQIALVAERFPGDHELRVVIVHDDDVLLARFAHGARRVRVPARVSFLWLGAQWRYDGSAACLAALAEFGDPCLLTASPSSGRRRRSLLARAWGRARGRTPRPWRTSA